MTTTTRLIIVGVLAVLVGGAIVLKETGNRAGPEDEVSQTTDSLATMADAALLEGNKADTVPAEGDEAVANPPGRLPRLVDLGSDQCIPCKLMAPILEELKKEYAHRFTIEFIDARKNRPAAALYGIRVIPTQIFYDASGDELFRHEGFMSKEAILAKWLELGVDIRKS